MPLLYEVICRMVHLAFRERPHFLHRTPSAHQGLPGTRATRVRCAEPPGSSFLSPKKSLFCLEKTRCFPASYVPNVCRFFSTKPAAPPPRGTLRIPKLTGKNPLPRVPPDPPAQRLLYSSPTSIPRSSLSGRPRPGTRPPTATSTQREPHVVCYSRNFLPRIAVLQLASVGRCGGHRLHGAVRHPIHLRSTASRVAHRFGGFDPHLPRGSRVERLVSKLARHPATTRNLLRPPHVGLHGPRFARRRPLRPSEWPLLLHFQTHLDSPHACRDLGRPHPPP